MRLRTALGTPLVPRPILSLFFFFNDTATTEIYTLSLHDALPICWELPLFYHVPTVLGKDKKKLSKRHNAPSWIELKEKGFLPEAVFNFLKVRYVSS